jgi:hypothetical protein
LVTSQNVPAGTKFGGVEVGGGDYIGGTELVGAAPDANSAVLTAPLALTEGFVMPEGEAEPRQSLYRWNKETHALQLVSWLPPTAETPKETPAVLAGDKTGLGYRDVVVRHAVSQDGNRLIYGTEGPAGEKHLFLRDMRLGKSVQLDVREDGTSGGGEARFQDASLDGRVVYFTDEERLTSNATGEHNREAADLYRCEVQESASGLGCKPEDVTVPVGPHELSDVRGNIVGTDASGDRVYFVANGRLTPDAVHGDCPHVGNASAMPPADTSCNLYVADATSGETRLVAILSGRDFPDWGAEDTENLQWLTARVSLSGRYLAFMSQRSLTGYDNRDAHSGAPDEEVFEYDFDRSQLTCASCKRTGARPDGVFDSGAFPGLLVDRPQIWRGQSVAASIPGWTSVTKAGPLVRSAYQSRYLANDGRLFFNSHDDLVSGDANGQFDVYEYEPESTGSCGRGAACVALMSSGQDAEESAFLDASNEGEDVFFLTAARLSAADKDNVEDVYDAHVCPSGETCAPPSAPPLVSCEELDSCRPAPPAQLVSPTPPALGTGNLALNATGSKPKPVSRSQRLAKALKACRRHHAKKRRKACEAIARRRYGRKHSTASKHRRNG